VLIRVRTPLRQHNDMPRNIATATTFTYLQFIQWQPVRLLIYLRKSGCWWWSTDRAIFS